MIEQIDDGRWIEDSGVASRVQMEMSAGLSCGNDDLQHVVWIRRRQIVNGDVKVVSPQ
jgi:hypothetical protein